jgi:hypothetical protein
MDGDFGDPYFDFHFDSLTTEDTEVYSQRARRDLLKMMRG